MSGQLWSIDIVGGYMYADNLSDLLREEVLPVVKFRQFADAKDATKLGLHKGDTFRWNTYTQVKVGGGTLNETEEMPTTSFDIIQKLLTVTEYGNSVPWAGKLDDLSLHPVQEIVRRALKIDCVQTLDGACHAQFNGTFVKVSPVSGTDVSAIVVTEGAVAAQTTVAITKNHIKNIVDALKERNVPPFLNDDYYAIAWPTTWRTFKDELETISQYVETGFRHIMNGEIGRYEAMRFVEQTHIQKGGAEDSTSWTFRTADPWDSATAGTDWAFFMGEDTVAEAVVIPEEIRGRLPGDYGRSKGVAWYAILGYGLVHGSDAESAANARVFKWESAS